MALDIAGAQVKVLTMQGKETDVLNEANNLIKRAIDEVAALKAKVADLQAQIAAGSDLTVIGDQLDATTADLTALETKLKAVTF